MSLSSREQNNPESKEDVINASDLNQIINKALDGLNQSIEKALQTDPQTLKTYQDLYKKSDHSKQTQAQAEQLKKLTPEKKDLFEALSKLNTSIIQLKTNTSIRLRTCEDTGVVAEIQNKIPGIRQQLAAETQAIKQTQTQIRNNLNKLSVDAVLNLHPELKKYDQVLEGYHAQLENNKALFQQQFTQAQETKLELIETEIARTNNLRIQIEEEKFDINDLFSKSPLGNFFLQQKKKLERLNTNKLTTREIKKQADEAIQHLETFLKAENDLANPPYLKILDEIKYLCLKQKNPWIISNPWTTHSNSVTKALNALELAIASVTDLSMSHSLEKQKEIQQRLDILISCKTDIENLSDDSEMAELQTFSLKCDIDKKETEIKLRLTEKYIELQKEKLNDVTTTLEAEKQRYIAHLTELKTRLICEAKNQKDAERLLPLPEAKPAETFKLPSTRHLKVKASLGIILGAALGATAIALKVGVIAGLLASNPVGWGLAIAAAVIVVGIPLVTGIVHAAKAFNLRTKKKLLTPYQPSIQHDLFVTNEQLKKQKFSTSVRHTMMRFGIKIKPLQQQENPMPNQLACEIIGQENHSVPLFLDTNNKQLFFKSAEQTVIAAPKKDCFEAQLSQFRTLRMGE